MVHEIKSIRVALDERMYFNNEGERRKRRNDRRRMIDIFNHPPPLF